MKEEIKLSIQYFDRPRPVLAWRASIMRQVTVKKSFTL